jgi:hypothetical protein
VIQIKREMLWSKKYLSRKRRLFAAVGFHRDYDCVATEERESEIIPVSYTFNCKNEASGREHLIGVEEQKKCSLAKMSLSRNLWGT